MPQITPEPVYAHYCCAIFGVGNVTDGRQQRRIRERLTYAKGKMITTSRLFSRRTAIAVQKFGYSLFARSRGVPWNAGTRKEITNVIGWNTNGEPPVLDAGYCNCHANDASTATVKYRASAIARIGFQINTKYFYHILHSPRRGNVTRSRRQFQRT